MNLAIADGELPGWRAFTSLRCFPKYGTQRGWERIPKDVNKEGASDVNEHVSQPEKTSRWVSPCLKMTQIARFPPLVDRSVDIPVDANNAYISRLFGHLSTCLLST